MKAADVISDGDCEFVHLPKEFHLDGDKLTAHRQGLAVVLEPVLSNDWRPGYFDAIRIDDPTFVRPDQRVMPLAPKFDD